MTWKSGSGFELQGHDHSCSRDVALQIEAIPQVGTIEYSHDPFLKNILTTPFLPFYATPFYGAAGA